MTVPFARLKAAVNKERQDGEVRTVLGKLAKALVGKKAFKVMRDYDQRMCDLTSKDAGEAFLSCIPDCPLNAELFVDVGQPLSVVSLFSGAQGIQRILKHIAAAYAKRAEAVVLFKVRHFGFWVAYNTADPYPVSVPRIVFPAQSKGMSAVTFMPLATYLRMWEEKIGGVDGR